MTTIFDVANWFLTKESMSHKKLQKLCYYAQAWFFVLHDDDPIFNGSFEAWVHGPVNRRLWEKFKDYGYADIPQDALSGIAKKFESKDNELLESVWETYGEYTGFQLESLTHDESPWIEARKGLSSYEPSKNIISQDTMRECYASQYLGDGMGE